MCNLYGIQYLHVVQMIFYHPYLLKAGLKIVKYPIPCNDIKDMKFLSVRIWTPNFLRIKKSKEKLL